MLSMKLKRVCGFFCAVILLASVLTAMPYGEASAYSDIGSAELSSQVTILSSLGIINGFPDGSFRPDARLTRAQLSKLAVAALGANDQTELFKDYTIFPDVKSSHWAAPFINYMVKQKGIIKGFPDGTFKPEANVTFAQAVTILMRTLGYKDEHVGLNWPSSYLDRASLIGLSKGVSAKADDALTRGQAACLFYNMLLTKTVDGDGKAGTEFISTLTKSSVKEAVMLSVTETLFDGTKNAVLYGAVGAKTTAVAVKTPLPESFLGLSGSVYLDSDGILVAFLPDEQSVKEFTLGVCEADALVSSDGERIKLEEDAQLYFKRAWKSYGDAWIDLKPGSGVKVFYSKAGEIQYAFVMDTDTTGSDVITIALDTDRTDDEALAKRMSGKITSVYKNGETAQASDLRRDDILSYDKRTGVLSVSDCKLRGVVEYVLPNLESPKKLKMLNTEFELLARAQSQIKSFKAGDRIIALLSYDNKIASVMKWDKLSFFTYGIVESDGRVRVLGGPVIGEKAASEDDSKGTPVSSLAAGTFVRISQEKIGEVTVSAANDSGVSFQSLDLASGKYGQNTIAKGAVFIDRAIINGPSVVVKRKDISLSKIPSDRLLNVITNSAGQACAFVMDDVTGDCFRYGFINIYRELDKNVPEMIPELDANGDPKKDSNNEIIMKKNPAYPSYINYIALKNSDGEIKTGEVLASAGVQSGSIAGLAVQGIQYKTKELLSVKDITRSDFESGDDGDFIMISGERMPVSKDIQIYSAAYGRYLDSLSEARKLSNSFTVYYDRKASEGGKTRFISLNS